MTDIEINKGRGDATDTRPPARHTHEPVQNVGVAHAPVTEPPALCIVVPCYNEQEVLPLTSGLFREELERLASAGKIAPIPASHVLFVNDGSTDGTWNLIEGLASRDPAFRGIALSRNRGHQNALLAGLMEARATSDITISIDCDGQDDIRAMDRMVDAYLDGCDVVYGVRSDRGSDTFLKRTTAQGFYRLLAAMGVEVVYNHADYRLLSRRVLDELARYEEVNLYLRGMVPLIGFRATSVPYVRHERLAGSSHYTVRKMLSLAADGVTSLSIKPLRIVMAFGVIVSVLSFIGVIWAVIVSLLGKSVAGWASTVSIICFMGGIQLLALGIIGEYVGRIYLESKHRPRFIVAERTPEDLARNGEAGGPASSDAAGRVSADAPERTRAHSSAGTPKPDRAGDTSADAGHAEL